MGRRGVGWGGWWQKLKQRRKKKKIQIVEFRVRSYDMYIHPQKVNIPPQGLDR